MESAPSQHQREESQKPPKPMGYEEYMASITAQAKIIEDTEAFLAQISPDVTRNISVHSKVIEREMKKIAEAKGKIEEIKRRNREEITKTLH